MFLYSHGSTCTTTNHQYNEQTHYSKTYKVKGYGNSRTIVQLAEAALSSLKQNDNKFFFLFDKDLKLTPVSDGLKVFLDFLLGSVMDNNDVIKTFFLKEAVKYIAMVNHIEEEKFLKIIKVNQKAMELVKNRAEKSCSDYRDGLEFLTDNRFSDLYDSFKIDVGNERGFMKINQKDGKNFEPIDIVAYISPQDEGIKCLGDFISNISDSTQCIGLLTCLPHGEN